MKILIFAPFFPPDPTGSSVFAGQQVRELTRLGHEVLVVTNNVDDDAPAFTDSDSKDSLGSDQILRLRSLRINLGSVTWNYSIPLSFLGFVKRRPRRVMRNFDPDRVIIHSTLFDLSLLGLWWARRHAKPTAIVSHTALWHDKRLINFLMRIYGRQILKKLITWSRAKVIAVDKWTFENAIGLFSAPEHTETIPVSVELGKMADGDGGKIRMRHGITSAPVILSLGHVIPLRNRVNLINSLPILRETYPDLRVVIVGMVHDEEFLKVARKVGVEDHLVLAGPVPHSEIKDYLAMADVEMHDLDGLGLGITSVEAMDAGVPIVAWSVDDNYPQYSLRSYGLNGFIDDGEPTTIAEKTTDILQDYTVRQQIVASQRRLVDEIFSVSSVTKKYLEVFRD